jgi:hypothetical protein
MRLRSSGSSSPRSARSSLNFRGVSRRTFDRARRHVALMRVANVSTRGSLS